MIPRVTFERFPDKPLVSVNVDGKRVGTYEIVDGGFVPSGRRSKTLIREEDARYLVIVDEAARRIREANRLMESVTKMFMKNEPMEFTDFLNDAGEQEYASWS